MATQNREIYFKFSPDGSAQDVSLSASELSQIGSFKRLKFSSITTPLLYYSISSINQQFALIERNDSSATTTTLITLTSGNYTSASFATELQTQLNNNDAYGSTYTVTISTTTGKLSITNNNGGTWNGFQIEFYTGNSGTSDTASKRVQAEKIWGVTPTLLSDAAPASPQIGSGSFVTSYTSSLPVQLWGPDQLLVVSPELKKMLVRYNTDIVDNQANILLCVPIVSSPFTQQTYTFDSTTISVNNQTLPSTITFNITDESGNSIDFNGGSCYLRVIVS